MQAAKYPYVVPETQNYNVWAEPSHRSFIRKAGSDFGWDWGPAYATTGISGPAYLDLGLGVPEVTDLAVLLVFPGDSANLSSVHLTAKVSLDGKGLQYDSLTLELSINGVHCTSKTVTDVFASDRNEEFDIQYVRPMLPDWPWPWSWLILSTVANKSVGGYTNTPLSSGTRWRTRRCGGRSGTATRIYTTYKSRLRQTADSTSPSRTKWASDTLSSFRNRPQQAT